MLRRALNFEVVWRRRRGRPKMTWKRQVEENGLKEDDAIDRPKWRDAVNKLSKIMR